MSCFTPIKAFIVGKDDFGKNIIELCSSDTVFIQRSDVSGRWLHITESSYKDNYAELQYWLDCVRCSSSDFPNVRTEYYLLPCRNCEGCHIDSARVWSQRMMMEATYHKHNWFLTLTYDDEHIPIVCRFDDDDLIDDIGYTLVKKDLQNFWKRLRNEVGKFRYYACGEYGRQSFRPHYHAIVFGLDLSKDNLELVSEKDLNGVRTRLFKSELLTRIWARGNVMVGEVTEASCAYVARYCMDKITGFNKVDFERIGLQVPFVVMSRRPGIGRKYYEEHKENYGAFNALYIPTPQGCTTAYPNNYFNRLFDVDDPLLSAFKKNQRRIFSMERMAIESSLTSLTPDEQRQVLRRNKEHVKKGLVRNL